MDSDIILQTSSQASLKKIYNGVISDQNNIVHSYEEGYDKVKQEKYALLIPSSRYVRMEDGKYCKPTVLKDNLLHTSRNLII